MQLQSLRISIALLALTFLGHSTATAVNLVVNGDFNLSVPSNGTGNGWTTSSVDFAGGWKSSGGNPDAFFALNDNGGVSDPLITQTISGLFIGQSYNLSGDYKLNLAAGGPSANSFEVRLDGADLLMLGPPGPFGFWAPFSTSFVATATSHTIGFAGETNGSDYDYGVDNVVLEIPEPTSLALLSAAALVALLRRRRV